MTSMNMMILYLMDVRSVVVADALSVWIAVEYFLLGVRNVIFVITTMSAPAG